MKIKKGATNALVKTNLGAAIILYTPAVELIQTLSVGNDPTFSSLTWSTDSVGSGDYANLKAIARWNTVQWQYLETASSHTVGVVAHHHEDIDYVEFCANGGDVIRVNSPSVNPQTGAIEYWCYLDITDDLTDAIEIRAIAVPTVGIPRILHGDFDTNVVSNVVGGIQGINDGEYSLIVYPLTSATGSKTIVYVDASYEGAFSDGTEEFPYKTIYDAVWTGLASETSSFENRTEIKRAELRLAAGTYRWKSASFPASSLLFSEGWLKIAGPEWSGNHKTDTPSVIIEGGDGGESYATQITEQRWNRLEFENIAFEIPTDFVTDNNLGGFSSPVFWQSGSDMYVWFNKCFMTGGLTLRDADDGAGGTYRKPDNVTFFRGFRSGFATNCISYETTGRPFSGQITRNCLLDGVYGDAFGGEGLNIGCEAKRVYRTLQLETQNSENIELYPSDSEQWPHPDITQIRLTGGTIDNVIIQDLEATYQVQCEGIFLSGQTSSFQNCAFVNINIDNNFDDPPNTEPSVVYNNLMLYDPLVHVIFRNVTANDAIALQIDGSPGTLDPRANFQNVLFEDVFDIESPSDFLFVLPDASSGASGPDGRNSSAAFLSGSELEWFSDGTSILYRRS